MLMFIPIESILNRQRILYCYSVLYYGLIIVTLHCSAWVFACCPVFWLVCCAPHQAA